MPRDNLLKEAIADAKTVRDTAIANARLTLEEAFKPHLSSMLSARLRNEIEGVDGSAVNEDNDGTSGIGTGITVNDPAPKQPSAKSSSSSHIENPGQEEETMGQGNIHKKPMKESKPMGKGDPNKKPVKESGYILAGGRDEQPTDESGYILAGGRDEQPTDESGYILAGGRDEMGEEGDIDLDSELGMGGEGGEEIPGAEGGMGAMGADGVADTPDELDLEAIIRELELDVQGDSGLAPQGGPEEDESGYILAGGRDEQPTEESGYILAGGREGTDESFANVNAGKQVDGAFDGSVKPRNEARRLRNETLAGKSGDGEFHDGKSPTAVDGVNGGKKVTPGQQVTAAKKEKMEESGYILAGGREDDSANEEVDLDEILREVAAEEVNESSTRIASENVELKRSLREHREVIQFLRGKLQEVNMLNAKLLFTNKLFKGFNLGENQKLHIVESFDRATTLREVKLIYTTLAESLHGKLTTQKKGAKMVAEGLASKPMGNTKPKSPAANATILAEGNDMVARLQKLAGIKPN